MKIQFTLKLKPMAKSHAVRIMEVRNPQTGPHATTCSKCQDKHFAAFAFAQSKDYTASFEAIRMAAKQAMKTEGNMEPLPGPVFLDVEIQQERPAAHYNSTGDIHERCLELLPSSSRPALPRLQDTIIAALNNVAFTTPRQIVKIQMERTFGKDNRISVMAKQYHGANQMDLFE